MPGRTGPSVAHCHLRYLNPFPPNFGEILKRYKKVLIPELNLGQLRTLLRAKFLVDAVGLNKVQGHPFPVREIVEQDRRNLAEVQPLRPPIASPVSLREQRRPFRGAKGDYNHQQLTTDTSRRAMSTQTTLPVLTANDFASDQDVRWCPGCGDYSILAQMKKVLRHARHPPREDRVHLAASAAPAASRTT